MCPGFTKTPFHSNFLASRSHPCSMHHRALGPVLPYIYYAPPPYPHSLQTLWPSSRCPLLKRPKVHLLCDVHWSLDDGICRDRDGEHELLPPDSPPTIISPTHWCLPSARPQPRHVTCMYCNLPESSTRRAITLGFILQ